MKILAIKSRRLGDTVLWTSALQALREYFPGSQIDLALPGQYVALFEHDTRYRTLYPLDRDPPNPQDNNPWRGERYDLVLAFHASPTTRRIARSARGRRTLIHHHSRHPRRFGSDEPIVNAGRAQNAIERDLNVIRTLGWSGSPPPTRILPPEHAREHALKQWTGRFGSPPKDLLLLCPGASRPAKRWPLERYLQTARLLQEQRSVCVLAMDAAERPAMADWPEYRSIPWFFTPTLQDIMGWIILSRAVVGADSGIKHLSIALGARTLTLFGPESVAEWHPYDLNEHRVIQNSVGCRDQDPDDPQFAWCAAEVCPLGSHACLSLTSVKHVIETIQRYL